jgi:putative NADPH-quinone reductase
MHVLVIYCHPDKVSLASALHDTVIETLSASGHMVMDLDLYGEQFDPVFSLQDRINYNDTSLYYTTVEKYARQLAAAEALVVVFPTWWYGMPAMLKGYFDKVWAPGVAYDVRSDGAVDTSRLAHIRRVAVVTTYGGTWWFIRLFMAEPTRKLFTRGIRHLCGRHCKLEWLACYNMNQPDPERIGRFVARVRTRIARW